MSPRVLEVDGQRAVLRERCVALPDGDLGWYQRSQTDCLRAAVATATQIPYSELPDFRDEVELDAWALDAGWTLRRCEQPPNVRRWLGVSPPFEHHGNARHTLVIAWDAVYFDPASGWEFEGGLRAEPTRFIEYGLVIERC